jgi:hypothetical protein
LDGGGRVAVTGELNRSVRTDKGLGDAEIRLKDLIAGVIGETGIGPARKGRSTGNGGIGELRAGNQWMGDLQNGHGGTVTGNSQDWCLTGRTRGRE